MFDQTEEGVNALLVQMDFFSSSMDLEDLKEFHELAISAGLNPVGDIVTKRDKPDPKYFIGSGKVEEILQLLQNETIDLILVNHELTPSQKRNLERSLSKRVIDRTQLILEIFAKRARTFEGKLQVELAQLKYLSTHLVRGWTHLERQKGGIGLRGGPGETQLEVDRRLIRKRIESIKKRLERVRRQRALRRERRLQSTIPTVSLVGYTNAGKSTLFNALTQSKVLVADQLFATLDPTLRQLSLPYLGRVIFADTVGFIRHLPHNLIEAFQATLEETREAQLLLHVVDLSQENYRENIDSVSTVLSEIQAESVPQLIVFNKVDLLEDFQPKIERDASTGRPKQVWVSALKGLGIDVLIQAIQECLSSQEIHCCIRLKPFEGHLRSIFYDMNAVLAEQYDDNGDCLLEIKLGKLKLAQLLFGSVV